MQQLAWSPILQNPVTDLVSVRQNPATHLVFPIELLDFDKRRPNKLLDFDESATKQGAVFFQDHIDIKTLLKKYVVAKSQKSKCCENETKSINHLVCFIKFLVSPATYYDRLQQIEAQLRTSDNIFFFPISEL